MTIEKKKIKVGIIFGGKSAEHEISLLSAKNVVEALDKSKYEITLIGIDKKGHWFINNDQAHYLLNASDPKLIRFNKENNQTTDLVIVPGDDNSSKLQSLSKQKPLAELDVVFPVLHGTNGEDGTIQGLFKMIDVAFVGPDHLGSGAAMDKDVTKRLMRDAGIPIAAFHCINSFQFEQGKVDLQAIVEEIGLPLFVKPSRAGSSVGISKVKKMEDLKKALADAFQYDTKVLIEEAVVGREIEIAVLGNEDPKASLAGEILPQHEFYSYEAKYIDEKGAVLKYPADLSPAQMEEVRSLATKAFTACACEGMSRVDFFLRKSDNKFILNEINTIPGFTKISMYPKLWEITGIKYSELLNQLLELAIKRHERDRKLQTNFSG